VCALESMLAELLHLVLRKTISSFTDVHPESQGEKKKKKKKNRILKQILAQKVKKILVPFYS